MEELVDAGPVFVQKKYEIKNNDTTDSLLTELNSLGGIFKVSVTFNCLVERVGIKNKAPH